MPVDTTGAHHVEHVMGMPVSIDLRDELPGDRAAAVIAEVVEWLHLVDRTWSTWKDDSTITRFARGEIREADLPRSMHDVLDRCEELSAMTNGAFDIHVPAPNGTWLEPSGFVKGWAVQRAADLLDAHGIEHSCINAGGDIVVRGCAAPGTPWRVGIRHPERTDALAGVLALSGDWAVATSGTYERGHHIVDPRTGEAATGLASVTVVGHDLALVDVAATAVFVMGPQDGPLWLLDHAAEGLDGMVVTRDGRCISTPGIDALRSS